jgi:hypothetical protein
VLEKFRHDLAQLEAKATQEAADPFEQLALRGSYLALQARLAWVNEVIEALSTTGHARNDRSGAAGAGGS